MNKAELTAPPQFTLPVCTFDRGSTNSITTNGNQLRQGAFYAPAWGLQEGQPSMEGDLTKVLAQLAQLGGHKEVEVDIRLRLPPHMKKQADTPQEKQAKKPTKEPRIEPRFTHKPEVTWVRKKEAMALLGCCRTTIDNYVKQGRIKRVYRGRTPLFDKQSVLDVLEKE